MFGRNSSTAPQEVELRPAEDAGGEEEVVDVTTRKGLSGLALEDVLSISDEDVERQITKEFPDADMVPSVYDVIGTCMTDTQEEKFAGAGYSVGDWVEVQGPDSQWKLTYVKRIIKQAPDDWDWNDPDNAGEEPEYNFFYNCGEYRMLEEDYLRSPQEGLRRIFGMRPWVWRTYALLRFENFIRFQKNHENDFDEVDAQQYARNLWSEWLEDPRNADFKMRFEEVGEIAQVELVEHILAPFIDIDDVTEDDEIWDFEDENISTYTYLAVCGTGGLIPFVCLFMQFIIPMLLLFAALGDREYDPSVRKVDQIVDSIFSCDIVPYSTFPKDDDQGGAYNSLHGKVMAFLVVAFYFFKVVPDTFVSFYNTAGTADTTYSRIMSMRKMVWDQGDDYVGQMLGYKFDLYMNTAFECFLYMLNLFIIYNTNDILDVILNALAIEFVHQLDEDFRGSDWWDADDRHIQAGVCELIIQKTLDLNVLQDPKRFAHVYHIDEDKVVAACGGNGGGLCNRILALDDQENVKFMNGAEAMAHRCALAAKKLDKKFAIDEFEKSVSYFGFEGKLYEIFTGGNTSLAVFNKLENYRVWSRWEKVLFLGDIPEPCWEDEEANKKIVSSLSDPFKNHSLLAGSSARRAFMVQIFEVFTFYYMYKNVVRCWKNKNYAAAVFRMFDGVINWFALLIQMAFPIIVVASLVYVPMCY